MNQHAEIIYDGAIESKEYEDIIYKVIDKCFEIEGLKELKLYCSITLTLADKIRQLNKDYRDIDKVTDVLSFPMFEKEELQNINKENFLNGEEVLGDIVINVKRVEEQAIEYGHSNQRELAYMVVHGFYHLMGYDHIEEKDKDQMRKKEEEILELLNITREGI